jgi:DNA-directed RNA polymerase beta subunit
MEVWALEVYGAANIRKELLTVNRTTSSGASRRTGDRQVRRSSRPACRSRSGVPSGLRSLGLNAEILDPNEEEIIGGGRCLRLLLPDLGGINLAGFED